MRALVQSAAAGYGQIATTWKTVSFLNRIENQSVGDLKTVLCAPHIDRVLPSDALTYTCAMRKLHLCPLLRGNVLCNR